MEPIVGDVAPAGALPRGADTPPPGFLCRSPFEYVHIQANGDVYPCCPSKFGKVIGNLTRQTLEEVWHSDAARAVRESIIDGSYRFCNAGACEYLCGAADRGEELSPPELVSWSSRQGLLDPLSSPRVANFGFDRLCNLSCSYCRKSLFRPSEQDLQRTETIDANVFRSSLEDTRRIVLLGEGDPFASPFYRDKLMQYDWSRHPRLRIKIQTNGLLLTRERWQSITASHAAIDWISVSVDAASAETYRINRGGDFDLLLRNLDFIANLRALGDIDRFCVNFLVQANNFHEMPAFARLGRGLGCDQVEFQRIENWGTFSDEQFRARAVHERGHPRHADFRRVLEDPVLHDPLVWLLKLAPRKPNTDPIGVMSWDDCVTEDAP
jgi:radical SAM protein with 4Fe4S-binding SPASM domain